MSISSLVVALFLAQEAPVDWSDYLVLDRCEAGARELQPSKLPQLLDRTINSVVNGEPAEVRLVGEDVVVEFDDTDSANIFILEVDTHFNAEYDLDVDLSFVVLDNEIVVRWKETYLHRQYRQGLFRISGSGISEICTGTGGGR